MVYGIVKISEIHDPDTTMDCVLCSGTKKGHIMGRSGDDLYIIDRSQKFDCIMCNGSGKMRLQNIDHRYVVVGGDSVSHDYIYGIRKRPIKGGMWLVKDGRRLPLAVDRVYCSALNACRSARKHLKLAATAAIEVVEFDEVAS